MFGDEKNTFKVVQREGRQFNIIVFSVLLLLSFIFFVATIRAPYCILFIVSGWFCIHCLVKRTSSFNCSNCKQSISNQRVDNCPKCGAFNEILIQEEKQQSPTERPMTNDERLELLERMKGLSSEVQENYKYPFDDVLAMLRPKYYLRYHRVQIEENGNTQSYVVHFCSPKETWKDLCGVSGDFLIDPDTLAPRQFNMGAIS